MYRMQREREVWGEAWRELRDLRTPSFFPIPSWNVLNAEALLVNCKELTRKSLASASQSISSAFLLRLYAIHTPNRPRGAFSPRLEL